MMAGLTRTSAQPLRFQELVDIDVARQDRTARRQEVLDGDSDRPRVYGRVVSGRVPEVDVEHIGNDVLEQDAVVDVTGAAPCVSFLRKGNFYATLEGEGVPRAGGSSLKESLLEARDILQNSFQSVLYELGASHDVLR